MQAFRKKKKENVQHEEVQLQSGGEFPFYEDQEAKTRLMSFLVRCGCTGQYTAINLHHHNNNPRQCCCCCCFSTFNCFCLY